MPLIVLYDPEEGRERIDPGRRAYAIPSENPMFVDAHIHYWARRAGNPFEDLDVLWIPRNARSGGAPFSRQFLNLFLETSITCTSGRKKISWKLLAMLILPLGNEEMNPKLFLA